MAEALSANVDRAELRKGTPHAPTAGAVHRPTAEGRSTEGGIRARMKAEDAAAKAATR